MSDIWLIWLYTSIIVISWLALTVLAIIVIQRFGENKKNNPNKEDE